MSPFLLGPSPCIVSAGPGRRVGDNYLKKWRSRVGVGTDLKDRVAMPACVQYYSSTNCLPRARKNEARMLLNAYYAYAYYHTLYAYELCIVCIHT